MPQDTSARGMHRVVGIVSGVVVGLAVVGVALALLPRAQAPGTATDAASSVTSADAATVDPRVTAPPRLAGEDRFATAAAVSRHRFPDGAALVYAAAADLSSDALVAAFVDGPTLLVPACGPVPEVVIDEIRRLGQPPVTVVGGTAAVDEAVAVQLRDARRDATAACGPHPAERAELLLDVGDDPNGTTVTGTVANRSDETIETTGGYGIERQTDDGSWELIGPDAFDGLPVPEPIPPGSTSRPERFVPYLGEEAVIYLDPGVYRFGVLVRRPGGVDAQPVSAVLEITTPPGR